MAAKKLKTKSKFEKGENVLCYEPDPAKTKVLYDSKVLKVVPKKDVQGRKFYKYLIHFHGWKSKWDTYVTDELILKDTEENRKLLKELADQAQLTLGGNSYRKERKISVVIPEPKRLVMEPTIISTDDKSYMEDENVPVPIDKILLPVRTLPDLEFPLADQAQLTLDRKSYRKKRKKSVVIPEPKRLVIEPTIISTDDKSYVEDENVPVPIDKILLPVRTLPDLEFPLADQAQLTLDRKLYRKKRKKSVVIPEPKRLVMEPTIISTDDKSYVEDENVPVPIDKILLPVRTLPDLEFPLADQAQLTLDRKLYRKKRKKSVVIPEPKRLVMEPTIISTDDKSYVEDENVPVPIDKILLPVRTLPDLEFPDNLKSHTEDNRNLVREKNKLIQLPCQPNVVTLFENYLRYVARNNFSDNKATKRKRQPEVLDEKQLKNRMLLVNKNEQVQYSEALKVTLQPPVNNIISQNVEQDYDNVPNYEELESHNNKNNVKVKRKNTRRPTSQYASSACSQTTSLRSKIVKDIFEKARKDYVLKADSWKAVPNSAYDEEIKQPAVVYGVYHLLRLLENLPEILAKTRIDGERLSIIYSYSNGLLKYLSTQTHLFGIQYYMKNKMDHTQKSSAPVRNRRKHKNI